MLKLFYANSKLKFNANSNFTKRTRHRKHLHLLGRCFAMRVLFLKLITETWPDGHYYSGEFDGTLQGEGVLVYKNGAVYIGHFTKQRLNGKLATRFISQIDVRKL